MKKNKYILLITLPIIILLSFVSPKDEKTNDLSPLEQRMLFLTSNMSAEDMNSLSPSKMEAMIGRDLTWAEAVALKKIKKHVTAEDSFSNDASGSKSQGVAFLLCWFFGYLGIHRFYLGYMWQGVVQILTGGGCGIWILIDWIRIIMNSLPDKSGNKLTKWFD